MAIKGIAGGFVLALVSTAAAAQPHLLPTSIAGTMSFAGPPPGFDAVTASPQLRQAYGFPPAPDLKRDPGAYAAWVRAMRRATTRITPQLVAGNVFHGPMAGRRTRLGSPDLSFSSTNWSGSVVTNGSTSWNSLSFMEVGSYINVPVAAQPFGTCSGGWLYSTAWVGIDGGAGTQYGQDVLQAGIDADAYCSGPNTYTYYDAFYEWAPAVGVTIQNLPVSPGQELYVVVWATTPTTGYAYLENLTTGQAAGLGIAPPANTRLVGNSAEFIMERPTVGTSLANLARYTTEFLTEAFAGDNRGLGSYPGYAAAGDTLNYVTMLDNANKPISAPQLLGAASISISDEGSAQ